MKPRTIILRQLLMAAVDAAMVVFAFLLAYWVRFHSGLVPLFYETPPLTWYIAPLGIIALVYLMFFRSVRLYAIRQSPKPSGELGAIAHGATLASVVLMAMTFLYRDTSYSRMVVMLAWGLTTALVAAGRTLVRKGIAHWLPQWQRRPRLLVVGTGPSAIHLIQQLKGRGSHEVIGIIDTESSGAGNRPGSRLEGIPVLGTLTDLRHRLQNREADELILTEPEMPRHQVMSLIMQCEQEMVNFHMVPDLLGLLTTPVGTQSLDGIPLLGLRETPLGDPWNRFLKRAMDLTLATVGLIPTAFLWPLIALMIKLDSPGPVLYVQERVGQDGKVFTMNKFRTMRVGAEDQTGPVWAKPDDARRTRVGRLLRRWNLDELPQLIDVLKGEMSLVGPRPERPHFVRRFKQDVPRYMARHRIRSGITGWAQIHGLRGDTSIEERTRYDLYYLEHWSLWLDCKILWKSLRAVTNAY